MVHPTLEGQHEVPASAVGHWTRVGWRRADEPEEKTAEPVTPEPVAPEPTPNPPTPNRRQRTTTSKEGE
jgi:hypothetical protein